MILLIDPDQECLLIVVPAHREVALNETSLINISCPLHLPHHHYQAAVCRLSAAPEVGGVMYSNTVSCNFEDRVLRSFHYLMNNYTVGLHVLLVPVCVFCLYMCDRLVTCPLCTPPLLHISWWPVVRMCVG